jgi:hypothetical protein
MHHPRCFPKVQCGGERERVDLRSTASFFLHTHWGIKNDSYKLRRIHSM